MTAPTNTAETAAAAPTNIAEETKSPTSSPPPKKLRTTSPPPAPSEEEEEVNDNDSQNGSGGNGKYEEEGPIVPTFVNAGALQREANRTREGDLVLAYMSEEDIRHVRLKHGDKLHCRYGLFDHTEDLIGKVFGTKIYAPSGTDAQRPGRGGRPNTNRGKNKRNVQNMRGYVYLLKPNPLLWSKSLLHRTQILYHADIGMICQWMNLRPGSRVVESGTGTGSLSHSIGRLIYPEGRLFTFEFHETRHVDARREFETNGLGDVITVTHRDVVVNGFLLDDLVTENSIDAVFLDLPKPWLCIEHAQRVMKRGGSMICCFSPCIEQVQQNCDKLRETREFADIHTIECLVKPHFYRYIYADPTEMLFDEPAKRTIKPDGTLEKKPKRTDEQEKHTYVTAMSEMKGHTGYLTFARRYNFDVKSLSVEGPVTPADSTNSNGDDNSSSKDEALSTNE